MPTLTVVAGANGAGKSTATRWTREAFQNYPVLDPDAVAKSIAVTSRIHGSAIDAGRAILWDADSFLARQESFLVETTLSGSTYLHMMRRGSTYLHMMRRAAALGTDCD